MKEKGIRTKLGMVSSFDLLTARGTIFFCKGKKIKFHSTCFQSTPPTRFPNLGESVEAIFSDGVLVRALSPKEEIVVYIAISTLFVYK